MGWGLSWTAWYLHSPNHEGKCKESLEIVFVLAFKRKSSFNITQISFYLWNIYNSVLYSGHIPFGASDYEVMLSVYFYWCVELGNDSESPGLLLLLLLKVPIFWRCAGLQSKHCAKAKYLDVIVPLRLATEHLSFSPRTHPIWAWRAPAVRWQPTIASSPLINCWNDTPSHKQCIILWASETLRSAIVGAKYASTYHSKQVESTVGYWVCSGREREGCVWHVNSNQGSDIHQAPWPTVRINLGREDSQALFFVSASICRCLSHIHTSLFALYHCLPVFSYSSIYLLPFHHTLSLSLPPSIWLFVFFSRRPYILSLSPSFSQPVIKL